MQRFQIVQDKAGWSVFDEDSRRTAAGGSTRPAALCGLSLMTAVDWADRLNAARPIPR